MRNYFITAATAATLLFQQTMACTGITLKAEDGTVVRARTLEFGFDLENFNFIFIPKGTTYKGTTPSGNNGIAWTTKYAMGGANIFNYQHLVDGFNEQGLSIGLFYFPGYAGYEPYSEQNAAQSLAPWELGTWILGNFANLEEVKAHIDSVKVVAVFNQEIKGAPPVHYIVTDQKGNSLVLEYVNGKLNMYDNPIGIFTNAPSFDWHLTNLNNYINLKTNNAEPVHLNSLQLNGFGQGTGLLGLPGDYTPPSRFVRATLFSQTVVSAKNGDEAMRAAFHILNTADIPKGIAREVIQGQTFYDVTQFTNANDLKNLKFYFHTHPDRQIRVIDLTKLKGDKVLQISMQSPEQILDITAQTTEYKP